MISLTLPTVPFEHVAMDYARLRDEGVRLLERLAGQQWTDFNTHDPGITILEQLCYAITDLGYRIAYPIPELTASASPLPGPDEILTSDPVTLDDVRKLALDQDGVENAWVVERNEPELTFYYHSLSHQFRLRTDLGEAAAAPVQLRGLEQIIVQGNDSAIRNVTAALHGRRALASDSEVVKRDPYLIGLRASIEVDAVDNLVALVGEIRDRIDDHLAPQPRFSSRAKARAEGRRLDEILEGPLTRRGIIRELRDPPRTVYVSDLLHVVLDVPGVKAVRSLVLKGPTDLERWALEIPPGMVAKLAPLASAEDDHATTAELRLTRRDLQLSFSPTSVAAAVAVSAPALAVSERTAPPRRDLTRFASVQRQLPAAYGVGAAGLPNDANKERRALAKQLAAYLLIFDQLLANHFAQLAHAGELLSADGDARSYFAARVTDPELALEELHDADTPALALLIEKDQGGVERRQRFLAHLLARFAEDLGTHSLVRDSSTLLDDRRAFLREYAHLSAARGSGCNIYDADDLGGFAERLSHKLGLRDQRRVFVVEHILLRPVPEDIAQRADESEPQVPLLANVASGDPWSRQVSVVVNVAEEGTTFERLVEQTVIEETPAHLTARVQLFDDEWPAFISAWQDFRAALPPYRASKPAGALEQLRLRDARDRLVELLGLGATYPLRDIPVPEQIVATSGLQARIPLTFSQLGVTYELRQRDGRPIPGVTAVAGTGGAIELVTPTIRQDASFRILAKKGDRSAWLRTVVRIVEGVDVAVVAQIRLGLLDPRIDTPKPTDARLGDYGVQAEIEVLSSQEGVSYEVIESATSRVVSQAPVVGTSATIVLRTVPLQEDVDLRVRGTRAVADSTIPTTRTAVLDVVMPLRLRANRAVAATITPTVVAYGGAATVRLAATQASADYRLYRGRVRDRDFAFGASTDPTIAITVDGRTVSLSRPANPTEWQDSPEFVAVSDQVHRNGGAVEFAIGAPATDDAFLLVQASKEHESGPLGTGSERIRSAVQLDAALAVLVRPNPAQALHVEATFDDSVFRSVLVEGGQPGVFYELPPIERPAYFHQRDDVDEQLSKGIGQVPPPTSTPSSALVVEADFVVTRDVPVPMLPAPSPLLDSAVVAGTIIQVLARKAMSGLQVALPRPARLDALPVVTVDATGQVVAVEASRQDERYWIERNGQRLEEPIEGTGTQLKLAIGTIDRGASYVLVVTRVDPASLEVERHVPLTL